MLDRMMRLDTMCEGAAAELFDAALQEVLDNIDNPMTDVKQPRVITLKLTMRPLGEERRSCMASVSCSTKLAGVRPVSAAVSIGRHEGKMTAIEALKQEELFSSPVGRPTGLVAGTGKEG